MRGVRLLIAAGALMLLAAELTADVVMRLELNRETFMQFEPVVAVLTMRNTSGQVLVFGTEPEFKGYLEIELTDIAGRPLPGSGTKFDLKGLMLRSGADQKIRINLSGKVDVTKCGNYRVRLILGHPMLRDEYESNTRQFEVSTGRVFWQRRFGMPKLGDGHEAGTPPPLRSYTVKNLWDGAHLYYYLLVEDDENIYAMKRIGEVTNRDRASCEMDMLNRLHVLLPLQPKIFQYQVFDWTGNRELNKVYKSSKSVPFLFRDATTGEVGVLGGELASLGIDYTEDRLMPENPALGDSPDKPRVPVSPTRRAPAQAAAPAQADAPVGPVKP